MRKIWLLVDYILSFFKEKVGFLFFWFELVDLYCRLKVFLIFKLFLRKYRFIKIRFSDFIYDGKSYFGYSFLCICVWVYIYIDVVGLMFVE